MTLDELIAKAIQLREEFGGNTPVFLLTPRGYAPVALTDMPVFAGPDGETSGTAVLVGPG